MSTPPTAPRDAPIIGTDGNDLITVERSVSFQWVPAAGNSSMVYYYDDYWATGALENGTARPSTASGMVTFYGLSSGEPFQSNTNYVGFQFTDRNASLPWSDTSHSTSQWTYDPATGVLVPEMGIGDWDGLQAARFALDTVTFWSAAKSGAGMTDIEYGHWQLVPEIHNVSIFAGAGNDAIHGGQGNETLAGGDGNDVIRASVGNDLILGGAGNDRLHAGVGNQNLFGGDGNDTIWGGTGTQMLLGGDGRDVIHGGSGTQTLLGGAGSDELWGGAGIQFLQGGNGSDTLYAGSGDETLSGGAGRDTFVFSTAATGHDVVTDFHPGQDIVKIAAHFGGLTIVNPRDLLPLISADASGDAVLTVGSGFRLDLRHVAAQRVELHPSEFFRIA